jgi:exopolysaccharide production protein ExoQ
MSNRSLRYVFQVSEAFIIITLIFLADEVDFAHLIGSVNNIITYVVVIVLVLTRWKKVFHILTLDLTLTLLILMAIASVLWTADRAITLADLKGLARTVFFGAYLATRYSPSEQRLIFTGVAVLSLLLNLLTFTLFPSFAIDPHIAGSWKGIYIFKQFLGRAMAFSASIFLVNLLDKKSHQWLNLIPLLLSLTFLFLSQSKTNLIAIMVLVLLLPLYKITKQRLSVRWTLLLISLTLTIGIITLVSANLEFIIVNLLGKDLALNGRTPIWNLATSFLLQKPWLGYGYNAFWASDPGQLIIQNTWIRKLWQIEGELRRFHAHNAFLEIYLQLGIIGGTLLILNILLVLKRAYRLLRITGTVENFWRLEFLIFQLIYNMTEIPTYLSPFNMYWIIYVAIAYSTALEINRPRPSQQTALAKANA